MEREQRLQLKMIFYLVITWNCYLLGGGGGGGGVGGKNLGDGSLPGGEEWKNIQLVGGTPHHPHIPKKGKPCILQCRFIVESLNLQNQ